MSVDLVYDWERRRPSRIAALVQRTLAIVLAGMVFMSAWLAGAFGTGAMGASAFGSSAFGGSAPAAFAPASAVAAYDPATSRVLGATTFNGSSQYASTSSPPTTELEGASDFVFFGRFKLVSNTTNRAVISLGSSTTNYVALYIDTTDDLTLFRNDTSGGVANTILSGAPEGWYSFALRFNAGGGATLKYLRPDLVTPVTWDVGTDKGPSGLTGMTIGGRYRGGSVDYHWDSALADFAFGSSATAVTDAAMGAFCLGADPASAEVDAANHWPLQTDYADAIGSTDLTATGSPTQAEANADVVVLRDLTADSAHANYQADVVGGATFNGSNYLQNSGGWSQPSEDYYVATWVYLPDATPAATGRLWNEAGDATNNREVIITTVGGVQLRDELAGNTEQAALAGGTAVVGWQLVVALCTADGSSREIWHAPVGGALATASDATSQTPATVDTLTLGATDAGASNLESGAIFSSHRVFLASDVNDETKFLRSLLRNWSQDVPTPVHQWTLNGAAGLSDTGSAADTDLSWSASAAYGDGQVVSSHQHLLGVNGGVTWDATAGEIVGDGSTGYLRAMNAADWDTPLVITARVEPDNVGFGANGVIWSATDGTNDERLLLGKQADEARVIRTDGGTTRNATTATTALATNTPATLQGEFASTTSISITVDGASLATDAVSNDPSGLDREVWFRLEGATPGNYFDGSMRRACKHIDTADNKAARDWVEAS